MNNKDRFLAIVAIVERSERLGIGYGDRITRIMDIDNADRQFNLKLGEFLNSDDFNFVHDFCGIQANMDRSALKVVNCFLPRFASPNR